MGDCQLSGHPSKVHMGETYDNYLLKSVHTIERARSSTMRCSGCALIHGR